MMDELETLSALAERLTPRYVMGRLMPRGAAERLMPRRREPPGPPSVFRPAALPPELERLGMSIPAGSRLIGSYARGTLSQIFLDADRSPLHVLRFYEGELHARGWTRTDGGPRGSLWQGDLPFARAVFCRSSSGPSLHLRLERNRGGGTGVWLQLEADPQRSRCGAPPPSAPPPPARPWRLPIPPDARDAGGSGPSQGGGFYQELKTIRYQSIAADLPRRLSLADVEDPFRHDPGLEGVADCYERTLTGAGWRRRRAGRTGPVAWSSWSCPDETGQEVAGFFLAFGQGNRLCTWRIERDVAPGSRQAAEAARAARRAALRGVGVLPDLIAPPASDFVESPARVERRYLESGGYLYTAMDPEAVAGHYGRQIQAAGWERQGEGWDEVVAWSTWDWVARQRGWEDTLFLAVRPPGTDRYEILARAVVWSSV